LENLEAEVEIKSAWETVRENIKISGKLFRTEAEAMV
jgi:hypothetical protein